MPSRSKVEALRSFASKVWCASRGDLITASNTKGQKRAEKGKKVLKGNLNTNNTFVPLCSPLGPYQKSHRLLTISLY